MTTKAEQRHDAVVDKLRSEIHEQLTEIRELSEDFGAGTPEDVKAMRATLKALKSAARVAKQF